MLRYIRVPNGQFRGRIARVASHGNGNPKIFNLRILKLPGKEKGQTTIVERVLAQYEGIALSLSVAEKKAIEKLEENPVQIHKRQVDQKNQSTKANKTTTVKNSGPQKPAPQIGEQRIVVAEPSLIKKKGEHTKADVNDNVNINKKVKCDVEETKKPSGRGQGGLKRSSETLIELKTKKLKVSENDIPPSTIRNDR